MKKYCNKVKLKSIIRKTIIVSGVALLMLVTACHATPDTDVVTRKDGLDDMIVATASTSEDAALEQSAEVNWQYEKEYESGNSIYVDTVVDNANATNLPVISIKPRLFESGEEIKRITSTFCGDAKVYDQGEGSTKQQLEQGILETEAKIYKIENDMPTIPGKADSIVPEELKASQIESLRAMIEYYKEQLPGAKDESELLEAEYRFRDTKTSGYQVNMVTFLDEDSYAYIDFINRKQSDILGSTFMYGTNTSIFSGDVVATLVKPELMLNNVDFVDVKKRVDNYVEQMGINYMTLNMVSKSEKTYTLIYTRSYMELPESYVRRHLGTSTMDIDGSGIMMNLWTPEYLEITIYNDSVYKVYWNNPSEVSEIDNDNVETIKWDEAREIFETQMNYMLKPNSNQGEIKICITRIELGLVKLLMKDSEDDYKLVPSWNFFGYFQNESNPDGENGALVCFLTINALDGSIFDRGWMY